MDDSLLLITPPINSALMTLSSTSSSPSSSSMSAVKRSESSTIIYSDDSQAMSERVQILADSIYKEFERLIKAYDEQVVKDLMPLVVAILENLEQSCRDKQKVDVDSELLKEDNEQLLAQYEKERQQRRGAEQRFLALEDAMEDERKQLQGRLESLQSVIRMFEIKLKNSQEQVLRLEDKEQEMKKEYSKLHDRYTDLFKSHLDFKDRLKTMMSTNSCSSTNINSNSTADDTAYDVTLPRNFKFSGNKKNLAAVAADTTTSTDPFTTATRSRQKRIHANFHNNNDDDDDDDDDITNSVEGKVYTNDDDVINNNDHNNDDDNDNNNKGNGNDNKVGDDVVDGKSKNADDDVQVQKRLIRIDDRLRRSLIGDIDSIPVEKFCDDDGNYECHIRHSIEEDDDDDDDDAFGKRVTDHDGERVYTALEESLDEGVSKEIDNLIQENNELLETKHALNIVKDDLIAKVDELTGEKEILKDEVRSITQSKDRLKVKVNELEEEVKRLKEELEKEMNKDANTFIGEDESVAPGLRKRFTRLEMARVLMERNQYKEKLMELQEAVRWAEMVRATKDHPEFGGEKKSRSSLWNFFSNLFSTSVNNNNNSNSTNNNTNSSRSSNNNKSHNSSNNSSGFGLNSSSLINSLDDEERVGLNSLMDRKRIVIGRNDESSEVDKPTKSLAKNLSNKFLPLKEEPRLEAYGWSLPPKFQLTQLQIPTDQSELIGSAVGDQKFNVPMPVLCKPLIDEEIPSKIQCAAAVTWSGGLTKNGGYMVGASIFYNNNNNNNNNNGGAGAGGSGKGSPKNGRSFFMRHESVPDKKVSGGGHGEGGAGEGAAGAGADVGEVEKLNRELLEGSATISQSQSSFSIVNEAGSTNSTNPSHVWVCVIDQTGSHVVVMDAGSGGDVLEKFNVCTANVLCIASIPGATEDDYKHEGDNGEDEEKADTEGTSPVMTSSPSSPSSSLASSSSSVLPTHVKLVEVKNHEEKNLLTKLHRSLSRSNSRSSPKPDSAASELERTYAVLPTVWLGSISGSLYIFSAVPYSRKRLHVLKLEDSILAICHMRGKVFLALANGCLACFTRKFNGQWNTSNYHTIRITEPTNAVRAAVVVANKILWCSVANVIYVVNTQTYSIEKNFQAHPRRESHVRKMVWVGEGVWVVLRHDATLRLFHAYTHEHLQDVDIEPCVTKLLGSSKLGFSLVQISCLMVTCNKLWVGTGNGVVLCLPISEDISSAASTSSASNIPPNKSPTSTNFPGAIKPPGVVVRVYGGVKNDDVYPGSFVPYCSVSQVQLSFHGHKEAVKFLVGLPGNDKTPKQSQNKNSHIFRKFSSPLPASSSLSLPPLTASPSPIPLSSSPLAQQQTSSSPPSSSSSSSLSSTSGATVVAPKTMWVVCGGDGYVDFRRDDETSKADSKKKTSSFFGSKVDKSHVIVWQVSGP